MNDHAKLFDQLGALAQRRYQLAEKRLSAIGFNHTEARLLSLLAEDDGVAQDILSARLLIDRSNAGRALKRLEADGYITRTRDEADKRTNRVRMNEKGRAAIADIAAVKKAMSTELFSALTDREAAVATALLQKALASRTG